MTLHSVLSPQPSVLPSVLSVEDLRVYYATPHGPVKAVDGVSFALRPGERMGLIGESGSGKTTIGTALMRLTKPPGRIVGGRVLLNGRDLLINISGYEGDVATRETITLLGITALTLDDVTNV